MIFQQWPVLSTSHVLLLRPFPWRSRPNVLDDDTQASDLQHLRPAAGVPDPGVMWPALPEILAAEPEQRQGQSSHVIRMSSQVFMHVDCWAEAQQGRQHSFLVCALYNLRGFTVTSVSGESWKLPQNADVWTRRLRRETFQSNKCAAYQNM